MTKKIIPANDYGIYIEQTHAVIVTLRNDGSAERNEIKSSISSRERFKGETDDKTRASNAEHGNNRDTRHQNKLNTEIRKFCNTIISRLNDVSRIFIFGPSEAKFELQKALDKSRQFKNRYEELESTQQMNNDEIVRHSKKHFSYIERLDLNPE